MRRISSAWVGPAVAALVLTFAAGAWAQCNTNDVTHEYFNGVYTAPQRMVMNPFQYMEDCGSEFAPCEVAPGWIPWRDNWAQNGDFYMGPFTPAPIPDPGIDCEAQEIVMFYGNFGAVKQIQLEEGKSYKMHIWIKTGNGADIGPAVNNINWVEYGYDATGQTNDNAAGSLLWDIAPKAADQLNDYGVWHEYVHPFPFTLDQGNDTISVWLKVGSVDPAGITADFDYIWFEEVGGGGPECFDLPDEFEGTYDSGIAPDWIPINLPGGFTQIREEAPGVTGSAQRLKSFDSIFGVVKLFNVPTNQPFRLKVTVKTASADGSEAATAGATASFGFDPTGNFSDATAGTIIWNHDLNADPEAGFDTWTEYEIGPITTTNDCGAVWLWLDASGQTETPGIRVDYDNLMLATGEPPAPPEITDITRTAADEVTLSFTSVSGKVYRVWYKGMMTDPDWTTNDTSEVTATADTTDWIDDIMGVGSRNYRVEELP